MMKKQFKLFFWLSMGAFCIAWFGAGRESFQDPSFFQKLIMGMPLVAWFAWTAGHLDFLRD